MSEEAGGGAAPAGRGRLAPKVWIIAGLLLATGACALTYQTVWMRELRAVFGATSAASGAVLAIFMGGLGAGGLLLGPRLERSAHPLSMFALVEGLAAALAALSPVLIDGVRTLYLDLGGVRGLGDGGALAVRLVGTALAIGGPAFCMGASLPAAARAAATDADLGRRGLGAIYGVNTLGAVVGALASTFVLLEALGNRSTLWVACTVNAAVALVALRLDRGVVHAQAEAPVTSKKRASPPAELLVAAFGTGFVFFLAELVWYRVAGPLMGGTAFAFGLVLAMALIGIGLGGLGYAVAPASWSRGPLFAVSCALEGALLMVPFALGDRLVLLSYDLRASASGFFELAGGWALLCAILVLLPAFVSGFQFPLLLGLCGAGRDGIAADTGRVYAANTAGAIAGSLLGSFGLLPALGALGAWRLCGALLVVIGALWFVRHRPGPQTVLAWLSLAAVGALAAAAPGPTAVWRHTGIGSGHANLAPSGPERVRDMHTVHRSVLEEVEGVEAAIGFTKANGLSLMVGGKSDGNVSGDAPTTVGLSLVPAILHPAPRRAFVVGLGSGQTAGFLAEVAGMEKVEVAEIEPGVLAFAEHARASNFDVLDHPRVDVIIGDGREALLTSTERYDIISSEPSNPFRAGVAVFFTHEFYASAKAHLARGGLFSQWLQGYEIGPEALDLTLATLRSVFRHVAIWQVGSFDLLLLGSDHEVEFDADQVRARLGEEPFATWAARIAEVSDAEGVLSLHVDAGTFAESARRTVPVINSEDRTLLEFEFARKAGANSGYVPTDRLWATARQRGGDLPARRGHVDVDRVDYLRARRWLVQLGAAPPIRHPPGLAASRAVWRTATQDLGRAAPLIAQAPAPLSHDLAERRTWLEARAFLPSSHEDEAFRAEADALARALPGEVAAIRVRAALVAGDRPAAVAQTQALIEVARVDPWLDRALLGRALEALLAADPAPSDAALAEALGAEPFVGFLQDDLRVGAAIRLGARAGALDRCLALVLADEPWPRWTRPDLSARARCASASSDVGFQALTKADLASLGQAR